MQKYSQPQPNHQSQQVDYKQMYLHCKHNVAVFMRQVERQIIEILQQHRKEKEDMQKTINTLQQQIKYKQLSTQPPSLATSFLPQHTHRCIQSARSMPQYSNRQSTDRLLNTNSSHLNLAKHGSMKNSPSFRNSSSRQNQKENEYFPFQLSNFDSNRSNLSECYKGNSILAMRRAKKMRQVADNKMGQNVQSVADLLKSIRDSQPLPNNNQQEQKIVVKVLTPQMFASRRTIQTLSGSKTRMI